MGILTRIVELASWKDIASLRLANKNLFEAVEGAAIKLRPSIEIQQAQLIRLAQAFPNATALDLRGCTELNTVSLRDLLSLASVKDLHFDTR